jgi:hypothetical protein
MVLRNESINCLLFLKYIECISFCELEKGATELKLLYKIQLENADQVQQQRSFVVEKIVPIMDLLNSGELDDSNQLVETTYVAYFQDVAIMINYLFGSVVTKIN